MKAVIGIDIGSSAIKAVLFDMEGMRVLCSEHRALHSRVTECTLGHFEEDPRVIRDQTFDIIRSIAKFAKQEGLMIESMAFTGQMHGGLLVDSRLEPVTNFITWQDKRGDELLSNGRSYVNELRGIAPPDPTGVWIHTGFLISTLYWLQRQELVPPQAAHVLGIYDWLTSVLIQSPVTDISSAAAWGLYDPISKFWRHELIERATIARELLPEVSEPGQDLGPVFHTIAAELGLDIRVHIHAPIGDTQATYIGLERGPSEILLNFGTGSQSMWETTRHEATEGTDIRYLRDDRYLACAPTLAGSEAYNIAALFIREIVKEFSGLEISQSHALKVMDRLALESRTLGLRIDPIFRGSKFRPDEDRGSITAVSSDNFHPGSFLRALIEGMIEEVERPYRIRKENRVLTGLVGAGGGFINNPALQFVAQAKFDTQVRSARFEQAAAVGAAMLCAS